jgi:hypothetical protein
MITPTGKHRNYWEYFSGTKPAKNPEALGTTTATENDSSTQKPGERAAEFNCDRRENKSVRGPGRNTVSAGAVFRQ